MLATPGPVPGAPGWAFEFKWDGVRAIVSVGDGRAWVTSRNALDVTGSYPELGVLPRLLGDHRVLLDGEIVSLDRGGRPDFGILQSRMHVQHPSAELMARVPVAYFVFDLLHHDGTSLLAQPYQHRRDRLDALDLGGHTTTVVVPRAWPGPGADVLAAAREHGLEGVVAKRLDSRYEPGRRSRAWIKTPLLRTQEVVVGGWQAGAGRREGTIGSLLLGAFDGDGRLRYLGHVGTGFTDVMLRDLSARLSRIVRPTSPFADRVPREHARGAHWAEPLLVGEVAYRELTRDGRLRAASWRGLRADKQPDDVRVPAGGGPGRR